MVTWRLVSEEYDVGGGEVGRGRGHLVDELAQPGTSAPHVTMYVEAM